MLRKIIKYTDYDGNPREEEFFFNLSKFEAAELEASADGGLKKKLEKIAKEEDKEKIIAFFKDFILKSIGEKSPDGRRFIKTSEIRDSFAQTEAFVELFIELSTNAESAAIFANGVIPDAPDVQTLLKSVEEQTR